MFDGGSEDISDGIRGSTDEMTGSGTGSSSSSAMLDDVPAPEDHE